MSMEASLQNSGAYMVPFDVLRTTSGLEMTGIFPRWDREARTLLWVREAARTKREPFLIGVACGSVVWRAASKASLRMSWLTCLLYTSDAADERSSVDL